STRRNWKKNNNSRKGKIDADYDLVLVPSDGVSFSGSESDDSDWSVGWLEPSFHGDDDDSFAVLVPCYKQKEE
ncbi:hypothetical protein M569_00605, partial [Genlisea aurea]